MADNWEGGHWDGRRCAPEPRPVTPVCLQTMPVCLITLLPQESGLGITGTKHPTQSHIHPRRPPGRSPQHAFTVKLSNTTPPLNNFALPSLPLNSLVSWNVFFCRLGCLWCGDVGNKLHLCLCRQILAPALGTVWVPPHCKAPLVEVKFQLVYWFWGP